MRAIRGEPVEVWLRHGRPARFVWRGRMFTVMLVLDRRLTPGALPADTQDRSAGDRECWRVEATPERSMPATTYELCHDIAADRWLFSRT